MNHVGYIGLSGLIVVSISILIIAFPRQFEWLFWMSNLKQEQELRERWDRNLNFVATNPPNVTQQRLNGWQYFLAADQACWSFLHTALKNSSEQYELAIFTELIPTRPESDKFDAVRIECARVSFPNGQVVMLEGVSHMITYCHWDGRTYDSSMITRQEINSPCTSWGVIP